MVARGSNPVYGDFFQQPSVDPWGRKTAVKSSVSKIIALWPRKLSGSNGMKPVSGHC